MNILKLIKTHNYLNGNIFSLVEFLITAFAVGPFAVYYILYGPGLYAVIAIGIILNCLTISFIALWSLIKKEKSMGIITLYSNKDIRGQMAVEHPKLSRETFILCVGLLVPYSLLIASLYDAFKL